MKNILAILLCASMAYGFSSGDDISSSTNWLQLTQSMRDHTVMNLWATTEPWWGASWWMSHLYRTNTLPNIDPVWGTGSSTNGGWIRNPLYNEAGDSVTGSRVHPFGSGISKNPYISWYVYEAQTWITNWFNSGRAVLSGTETNWNGTQGGSNLTLQAALELSGMTNGVRRTYEMGPVTNLLVTGTSIPDATGIYTNIYSQVWRDSATNQIYLIPLESITNFVIATDGGSSTWSNTVPIVPVGQYEPLNNSTGTLTVAYLIDDTYIWTNGWAQSGDFIGLWLKEDFTNLLSTLKSAWYEPDFFDRENDEVPLYTVSGAWLKSASYIDQFTIGSSTTRVDLIVTNTLDPDCDGYYMENWINDYGEITLTNPSEIEQYAADEWIIFPYTGYIRVTGERPTVYGANGTYTSISSPVTNVPYLGGSGNAWKIDLIDSQYLLYDTTEPAYYKYHATGDVSHASTGYYEPDTLISESGDWQIVTNSGNAEVYRTDGMVTAIDSGVGDPINPDVSGDFYPLGDSLTNGIYDLFFDPAVPPVGRWCIGTTGATNAANAYFVGGPIPTTYGMFSVYQALGGLSATGELYIARTEWQKTGTNIVGTYSPQFTSISGYTDVATGTLYITTAPNCYVGTNLWGEYLGYIDYDGNTCDVEVAYFYRNNTTVTGLYQNIGTATSSGTAEVLNGLGWIGWDGYDEATEDSGLLYISNNYSSIVASNQAGMTFDGPTFVQDPADAAGHYRTIITGVSEDITSGDSPTNMLKRILLSITEYEKQYSPSCVVTQKFGDGSVITSLRELPSVTNVHLFNQDGYYTNSSGFTYTQGNKLPYVEYDLLPLGGDTFFEYTYDGITNSIVGYSLGSQYLQTNFVGWVMEFDVD